MACPVHHSIPGDVALEGEDLAPPGLGNRKSRVSGDEGVAEAKTKRRRKMRRVLYRLREVAQDLTTAKGVGRCGRRRIFKFPTEIRRGADGRAFFTGLLRCASVWECPVCMDRIQQGRALEVKALGVHHRGRGGELYMATLTIPHAYGEPLEQLRKHVAAAWRKVQAGRAWLELTKAVGLWGSVRALEVTVGPNGWHPHLHVLLMLEREISEQLRERLEAELRDRWASAVAGLGWRLPSKAHGVQLRRAYRDAYVVKLVDELIRGGRKAGRDRGGEALAHRSPLQLLEDVARERRPQDVALWLEYAKAMRGARQLTYGGKLREKAAREALGLTAADLQGDLELASLEERQPAVTVYTFEGAVWDDVVAPNIRLQLQLLGLAEALPPPAAQDAIVKAVWHAQGYEVPPF